MARFLLEASPGLTIESSLAGISKETWREAGRRIAEHRTQLDRRGSRQMWEIGDWLVLGEEQVFHTVKRSRVRELAAEVTGYSRHTLQMAVSVARKVPAEGRVDGLSWWHHLVVSKLPAADQMQWLTHAAELEWSVSRLRRELRTAGVIGTAPSPSPAEGLVKGLARMTRADIPPPLLEQLRAWWEREIV